MDNWFFTRIILYTHKLLEMAALSATCKAAAQVYKSPDTWDGEATVEPHMIRNYKCRAQFLRWWFMVCNNVNLYARLRRSFKHLLVDHLEDYSMLISAVFLEGHCSHDLFYQGLFIWETPSWDLQPIGTLLANSHGTRSVSIGDDFCYFVLADGPLPIGPFSFNLRPSPRFTSSGDIDVEMIIGYLPWPPSRLMIQAFDQPMMVSRTIPGSLYCEILEDDLVNGTADFQFQMHSDGSVHLLNLSLQREASVLSRSDCLPSKTGAYTIYFWHNCNKVVITCN
jgi:hypothetical protein